MSEDEDYDTFNVKNLQDIHDEIEKCKKNPKTAGMFVSGWDDAEQDIDVVKNPKANPIDHVLWAAENGDVDSLQELLTSQPSLVSARDSDGYSPLHRAAYGNHIAAISYLLSVGANVSATTELGWTPLHSACNWNNYKVVARLLASGANPHALSDGAQSPMHLAAAMSHSKSTLLVLMLREDTVDLAHKPNNSDETPEQLARGHGIYSPLFEMLLPAASFIHSQAFTYNPYVREQHNIE
ncbi:ankyrin repeat domain-containing protein 49 [Amyelois transitella]|uniref:ankyrin repeat domain-containing protein 49 n=1 Tax=Amyelois transitella TaxID=680683 RepID=UPI00067BE765|nr:ankyrin repeat domain-containing protein 49 [Amyelois transitella]XP_013194726.1 ankyrin repeat domain-containing protein 49 [Amyelois transitella]XP_013194727.1 ankyrin repeat domain-containing protein 49 [Amyelois transitella]